MEQTLINELIKLLCKGGGETFVGNFQKEVNTDNVYEKWTVEELAEAVKYVQYINEYFGRDEAVAIITSLVAKYKININGLSLGANPAADKVAVGDR